MKGIKTGGREKGTENKVKKDVKQAFQTLVEGNLSNIEKWLQEVGKENPAKACEILLKLSEFIVPKLKSVDQQIEISDRPMFVFTDISGKKIVEPDGF